RARLRRGRAARRPAGARRRTADGARRGGAGAPAGRHGAPAPRPHPSPRAGHAAVPRRARGAGDGDRGARGRHRRPRAGGGGLPRGRRPRLRAQRRGGGRRRARASRLSRSRRRRHGDRHRIGEADPLAAGGVPHAYRPAADDAMHRRPWVLGLSRADADCYRRAMPRAADNPPAVVLGGGIAGLAAARLLTRHYARVVVLERDTRPDVAEPESAYGGWQRRGVPQFRHSHAFLARLRLVLLAHLPEVLDRLRALGVRELGLAALAPPGVTLAPE